MRTCITCNTAKTESCFEKYRKSCKVCRNISRRVMFDDRKIERKKFIAELKSEPCSDCKQKFPPVAMDFDHLPGETKLFNISKEVSQSRSFEALREEIAKCELVCSNCHRVRTSTRLAAVAEEGMV